MAAPIENEEVKNYPSICEIEASVATGFERVAKEEIEEKLKVPVKPFRGNVVFTIPFEHVKRVYELHAVDNVYIVLNRFKDFPFSNDLEEALTQVEKFVSKINWKLGLDVWGQFFEFAHPISHLPADETLWKAEEYQEPPVKISKVDDVVHSDNETAEQVSPSAKQESKATDHKTQSEPCERIENVMDAVIHADVVVKTSENGAAGDAPVRKSTIPYNPSLPGFRATCYRTGKNHVFQSMQAAARFGGLIQDYFGWNVNLKNFDIEVVLNINDNDVSVMIPLTRKSLHRRNMSNLGPTTLRATIAYNMLRLCKIKAGDVVCDPMCGSGGIPIEAAVCWPSSVHLAGDIHEIGCNRTVQNVCDLNVHRKNLKKSQIKVDVMQWDVTDLPLKDDAVDIYVTDLPFGKRLGSKYDNRKLYPKTLKEMARTCKRETGRACFLTQDSRNLMKSLGALGHLWRRVFMTGINIGGLSATVTVLQRTKNYFTATDKD
ncbi:tRNA (guanine(6)-N(2))-methyltransferase THUMP3-like [Tubulanus polymorphus]|uniref:tRNA (guanine(6)-N(2))-methyltransferase THUMP3-like n=1 Tax=Tubulanus polymorphus TaxID=672921 RepID=UPI003DA23056